MKFSKNKILKVKHFEAMVFPPENSDFLEAPCAQGRLTDITKRLVSLTFFLNELMKQARFAGSRVPDDQEFKQEI